MKITITQLRKLIREELEENLWSEPMSDEEKEDQKKELENLPNDLPKPGPFFERKRK
jgi:hypothetical protein